jgi:hypothetical protein
MERGRVGKFLELVELSALDGFRCRLARCTWARNLVIVISW